MRSERIRRLFALPLALALVMGLVAHPIYAAAMDAKDAAVTMNISSATVDMSADMSMHGKCDGCAGNEKTAMPGACAAFCSGTIAVLLSVPVAIDAVPLGVLWPSVEAFSIGRTIPPDPYPPKPVVLS